MKNLRIVFMGTPFFAVTILKTLVEHQYSIVGVITAPDKPAGRGRKLHESDVKVYAKNQNLHILQPTNLKNEDFVKDLKSLNANLQVVVAFRMLPKIVWQMPKYGTFNLHASLLPNYRGAAPINWAIINGEKETGVSTFFIDQHIDTGEMILQEKIAIEDAETAGTLHDKLMELGSCLVIDTIRNIADGTITTQPQLDEPNIKTAYKLNKKNCKIDWTQSLDAIYNKIRGLNPYPGAWSTLLNNNEELDVKIYQAEKVIATHQNPIGLVIFNKKELKISVSEGYINILEIKLPGKRKMDAKSLLNGYLFNTKAKML